ncbi:hypothetical protein Golob_006523 [Gossypium lobatum]|uniref:Uncharacterized protein n=1 Tax=Gossypium lobatum TaxID=34289 RepID=A0A7J8MWJ4_9ROSI|nr:hypothetical protein [Gossypium lobatum]
MARTALFHLLRSQSKQLISRNIHSGSLFLYLGTPPSVLFFILYKRQYHVLLLILLSAALGYRCRLATLSGTQFAKPNLNYATSIFSVQKRWASQAKTTEDDNKISIGPRKNKEDDEDEKDAGVVYHGPISSTIKKVKMLSLSTCCLSVSLGPVITFMTSPDMNVIVKGAVASSVIFLSATTTAALHWFVSPYIHKIRWQPGSDSFEVEMMSWLATYIPRTIKFADIRPAETNRPFVTFKANGNFYFVDAEHCHNKALLARLTPQKATHESALKNL